MAKYVLGLKLSNCKKMAMHTSTPTLTSAWAPSPTSARSREVAGLFNKGKRGYVSDFFLNLHF